MADPDVEVRVDPGARKDRLQRRRAAWPAARVGHRHRRELGMMFEPPVQCAKKRTAAPLAMLPGILAVEDDGNDGLSPAGALAEAPAGIDEPVHEVLSGSDRIPP